MQLHNLALITNINPSVPYSELTYLQFSMMPNLFENYIQILLNQEEYGKIGDLFVLYAQTLFELKPLPLNQDQIMSNMKYIKNSAACTQMVKLLKIIMKSLPIEHKPRTSSITIPNCIYTYTINLIIDQLNLELDLYEDRQYLKQINNEITYYNSLTYYFTMLYLEQSIIKNKKIHNIKQKYELIEEMGRFYENSLLKIRSQSQVYGKYVHQFVAIMEKLKYVLSLQPLGDDKQRQELVIENINMPAINTHINYLYTKCKTRTQKINFIHYYYNMERASSKMRFSCESMCYLFLEQYKNIKFTHKLEIYLVLLSIKIESSVTLEGILDELKAMFAYRVPSILFAYFLLYSIIDTFGQTMMTIFDSEVREIIDFLLKTYSKQHNNDKLYIRLAVLCSLFLQFKSNQINFSLSNPNSTQNLTQTININSSNIKNTNRKQLLERLCSNYDIIPYINNRQMLNYILELALAGKEIRLFDTLPNKKSRGKVECFMEIEHHNTNIFQELISYKQAFQLFEDYLIKINIVQDPTTSEQNSQQPVSEQKLHNLIENILIKSNELIDIIQYSDYFHYKLLTIIYLTAYCTKFTFESLEQIVAVLESYCALAWYQSYVNDRVSKLLLILLLYSLGATHHRQEGLICYLLIFDKPAIDKLETYIAQNLEDFSHINSQLFDCLTNYQIVQVLNQRCKGVYDKLLLQWVGKEQNYLYTWPESKRDKVLLMKKQRFIKYLKAKILTKKQQQISL